MSKLQDITYVDWQPKMNSLDEIVEGADDINQCIAIIILTQKGSVPHRPTFGTDIYKYIDYPVNEAIPNIVREVSDAVTAWETRITLNTVIATIKQSAIHIKVEWTLKETLTKGETTVIL